MITLGVFTKYNIKKDFYKNYHCSPSKIFKIISELKGIVDAECFFNDYSIDYDFAIVDRISPSKKIKSPYVLGIFETRMRAEWATDFCTISPAIKVAGPNQFRLLNYCHGKPISKERLSKVRSNGVFLGRIADSSEFKLKALSRHGLKTDIYPIKYWRGNSILRFHGGKKESRNNLIYLQDRFPGSKIRKPESHDKLYSVINKRGYAYGFVPSIYRFDSKKKQVESSSKFFEYMGCGIPVLVEHNVPESRIVRKNPFLGEIFCGEKDMLQKAFSMSSREYDKVRILEFAQKNHYPKNRARKIYNHFIRDRV